MKTQGPKDARGQIHSQKMRCRNRTENSLHSKRHRKDRCIIRHLARVRHVHHARNYRDRRADLPRLGHSTSTRNPMADWQMRTKRPLREPVREEAGPTLKNYITPAGLQRLKDEHRFLLSRERPAVVEVVAWAASNGDRSENADYLYGKRRLVQTDSRIRFLTKRIDAAVVVDPAAPRPGPAATRVNAFREKANPRIKQNGRAHVRTTVT